MLVRCGFLLGQFCIVKYNCRKSMLVVAVILLTGRVLVTGNGDHCKIFVVHYTITYYTVVYSNEGITTD